MNGNDPNNPYLNQPGQGGEVAVQYQQGTDVTALGVYPMGGYGGPGTMPGVTRSTEELMMLLGVDGTPPSLKTHWALAGPLARHLQLINIPNEYWLNQWILDVYQVLVSRYMDDDWDATEDDPFKDRSYFNEQQLFLVAQQLVFKSISFFGSPREREFLATYFTSSYQRIRGDEPPSGGFWGGVAKLVRGNRTPASGGWR